MARKNVASGNEHVEFQIGEIRPTSGKAQDAKPGNVRAENIREGNATVGRQIDHLEGTVNFF